eukprot:s418_g27.t1
MGHSERWKATSEDRPLPESFSSTYKQSSIRRFVSAAAMASICELVLKLGPEDQSLILEVLNQRQEDGLWPSCCRVLAVLLLVPATPRAAAGASTGQGKSPAPAAAPPAPAAAPGKAGGDGGGAASETTAPAAPRAFRNGPESNAA